MSLSDMDDDLALAALLGRGPRDADETALAGVLGRVTALAEGPAPTPSAGLAAFLAAQAAQAAPAVLEAAPVVAAPRSTGRSLLRRLVPAGLAAKVVLGAAGVAVAGTTSLGAAALVTGDDVPPRRPVVVQPSPVVVQPSPVVVPAPAPAGDADVDGPASRASRAVEAQREGREPADQRAGVPGGATRAPEADRPTARPDRPAADAGRGAQDAPDDRARRPAARPTQRPGARPTERPQEPVQREQRGEQPAAPVDQRGGPTSYGVERRQAPASEPGGPTEGRPAPRTEVAPTDN